MLSKYKVATLFTTLIMCSPTLAKSDLAPEIEEPIGITTEIDQEEYQCFDRNDWTQLGSLILHYHCVHNVARLYALEIDRQEKRIVNLTRFKSELLLAQNQILVTDEKLRAALENERRKKRLFAWFAGISSGVSLVLGAIIYGVSK